MMDSKTVILALFIRTKNPNVSVFSFKYSYGANEILIVLYKKHGNNPEYTHINWMICGWQLNIDLTFFAHLIETNLEKQAILDSLKEKKKNSRDATFWIKPSFIIPNIRCRYTSQQTVFFFFDS